jgi:hypothetical protein
MKPRIGIGLTTYKDIRSPAFARSLYEVFTEASPKLVPTGLRVINERHPVASADDFADHWFNERVLVAIPKYGTTPPPVQAQIGPAWQTRGALSGDGEVHFGKYGDGWSGIVLHHSYSSKVDWNGLFRQLVVLCEPAHAMLHLFTERELQRAGEGRVAFKQAFCGEPNFTYWKSSLGEWRKPDEWQREERRRYRFLPDLAWANVLGHEFDGRFDGQCLRKEAACFELLNGVAIAQVTDRIDDVLLAPEDFEDRRSRMKRAFAAETFRT